MDMSVDYPARYTDGVSSPDVCNVFSKTMSCEGACLTTILVPEVRVSDMSQEGM